MLRALVAELITLVSPAKPTLYLGLALLLSSLYWYLGSPGPHLAGVPRSLEAALATIGWALLLLLIVPLVVLLACREPWREFGLGLGDVRFGAGATALLALLVVPGLALGARLPEIQATYPWPGAWAGASVTNLLLWVLLYAAYYVAYEFFFRGFMLHTLKPLWGVKAAVWLQAVASALIHLGKPLPEMLLAIPFGFIFAVLAIRSRSLLWPILLHLIIGLSNDLFSLYFQGLLLP
ncbi:MAG: CPBP family intramembrane metalloprotease [Truepera sp.]|nr:CPBP family intramembrane metalloprotease [Truepera sp.]